LNILYALLPSCGPGPINKNLSNHAPFATVHQTLVSEALVFHRSSCALPNPAAESQRMHGVYRDKACILSQSLHPLLALLFWCILSNRLFILRLTRPAYLE
ncbi:hypothetical protein, partial [Acidithiobacillus ferridurans]|uniref:hypothetical protein n=1 Tax=Acidithiobacillus ferridurans TaxID=1232575 RepID=UPI001C07E203